MAKKKIICFLHGLESGPNGSKARHIQEHFGAAHIVLVPDMRMSLFDLSKHNSLARRLTLGRSMAGCTELVTRYLKAEISLILAGEGAAGNVEDSTSEQYFTPLEREAIASRLVLVGSSWGGAVALRACDAGNCASGQGAALRPFRTVLLAPALDACGWWSWFWPAWTPAALEGAGAGVTVFHGDGDDQVPVEASRRLKERFPAVDYVEIAGGDHRLNGALVDTGRLREALDGLVAE